MSEAVTGAVLAGGASRRFGSDKALARFRGERLIDRVVRALGAVCREVLIVGGDRDAYRDVAARYVADLRPGEGPLGGLATALGAASTAHVLLVACDMPLLGSQLLGAIAGRAGAADVVLPEGPDGPEPLCALYAARCRAAVEAALAAGARQMTAFHDRVTVLRIAREQLPGWTGLANVNTPEDLRRLEREAS
jgi:molybdopterin-guanine dinucleotide biosynthesis protein A